MEEASAGGPAPLRYHAAADRACRKTAARHPEVHILNCSVSMPYAGSAPTTAAFYEAKYIAGAIAGP